MILLIGSVSDIQVALRLIFDGIDMFLYRSLAKTTACEESVDKWVDRPNARMNIRIARVVMLANMG